MDTRHPRGRPQIRTDAEILRAALNSFAALGYDAMSVRAVSAEMGLSHETIRQRFGSKQELFVAASEYGIADFLRTVETVRAAEPDGLSDFDELRVRFRAFVIAASRHPEIGRLVNQEGQEPGERLDQLVQHAFQPVALTLAALLARLVERGVIWPTTTRELFFFAQASAAPFNVPQLSVAFDPIDGPVDFDAHIDRATELIMRGIRRS